MEPDIRKEPNFATEVLELIRSGLPKQQLLDRLSDYHENDIAGAAEQLTAEERKALYHLLGAEQAAEVFSYLEQPARFLQELEPECSARLLAGMDADDAIDVLEQLQEEDRQKLVQLLDHQSRSDIQRILSYAEDEIGSHMTNNYIVIQHTLSIRQAMRELIRQAGEHDNISTLYVVDATERFCGALDLKDLITAREDDQLEDLIVTSFPYVWDHEKVSECIEQLKDYAEDSIPVLGSDHHLAR